MKKILVLLTIFATMFSFAACKKEPVIGYDPEMPQEWKDAIEAEKNSTTTVVARTYDFDGIWRLQSTGEYYQIYDGYIFILDRLDAGEGEYTFWGSTIADQKIDKEIAASMSSSGGNGLATDDVINQHGYKEGVGAFEAVTTVINSSTTKTVTENGEEFIFAFVKECDGYPEGFEA